MKAGASISSVMKKARASNNGRLNSMALTASEIRCAKKAVERGLLKSWHAKFPGFGYVELLFLKVWVCCWLIPKQSNHALASVPVRG